MSSMRNAVQRRPHRERAQPLERRRLGLLEKHKDYSLRAQDYNKKKAQLKNLRDKAAERNDDEFYFGMMSRKGPGSKLMDGRRWAGTAQGDRGNRAMDVDTVRLLKTQDLGYVRTMRQVAVRELARLEQRAVLARGLDEIANDDNDENDDDDDDNDDDDIDMDLDDLDEDGDEDEVRGSRRRGSRKTGPARKIVFMDDEAQRDNLLRDALEKRAPKDMGKGSGNADGEGEGVSGNGNGNGNGNGKAQPSQEDKAKARKRLQKELEHARKKVKVLSNAESEMEVQKAKMAKTATSGGETRRGKKIMVRRRKR